MICSKIFTAFVSGQCIFRCQSLRLKTVGQKNDFSKIQNKHENNIIEYKAHGKSSTHEVYLTAHVQTIVYKNSCIF